MTIIPALLISAPIFYIGLGLIKACRTRWIIFPDVSWRVRLQALGFVVFVAPFYSLSAAASGGICLIGENEDKED